MKLGLKPQNFCSTWLFPSIWPHHLGYFCCIREDDRNSTGSEGCSDSLLLLIELLKTVAVRNRFAEVVFLKIETLKM